MLGRGHPVIKVRLSEETGLKELGTLGLTQELESLVNGVGWRRGTVKSYLMKGNNEDIVMEDRKDSVIHLCVFCVHGGCLTVFLGKDN